MAPRGTATLGGVHLYVDPDSVGWQFAMKVAEFNTVGGKVIQVFGTDLGSMTINGHFPNVKGQAMWETQQAFLAQCKKWAQDTQSYRDAPTLRFEYPLLGIRFDTYLKAYTGNGGGPAIQDDAGNFAPTYTLVLQIVEDHTKVVATKVKEQYIARLMNGLGWKATDFNGPKLEDVRALLADYGGNAENYLAAQAGLAAQGEAPGQNGGSQ